ncbi:MAG: hypothetical protein WC523_00205 [Patescibacteria group bacterium]
MGSLIVDRNSPAKGTPAVDLHELQKRLKSIVKEEDIEVIKLAIRTMLDEIVDGTR